MRRHVAQKESADLSAQSKPGGALSGNPNRIPSFSPGLRAARYLWHLLKYKQPFDPAVFAQEEAKMKRKKLQRLESMVESLN